VAERDRTEPDEQEEQRSTPLYRQLWFPVIVAIVLGILFGLLFEEQALEAQWLGEAFIQLIKAVTGPVIFVTVVIGIARAADGHVLGHLRGLRLRRARPGRPHVGLLDHPPHRPDPRRVADHPRHLVFGDRVAAPAREAPGCRRVLPRAR
jgi:hypothetical protein